MIENENLILIALLLVMSAIWWIIPGTRSKNGKWLIALKTFPLGLLVLILSSEAIRLLIYCFSELSRSNITCPGWIGNLVPLISALAAVIGSGIFIQRHWGTEVGYNPWPSLGMFFLTLIPLAICSFLLSMAIYLMTDGGYRGAWRTLWLDLGNREKIAFESQSIHPFLAEYNYRLRFIQEGKTIRRRLFVNTGGRIHFNIYMLEDGCFLFREKDYDYLVDTGRNRVSRIAVAGGKLYAAIIPDEEINFWGGPYSNGQGFFMDFNEHRVPAEEVTGLLDAMKYCGCITDKFYTASEKPETPIDFMRPR